MMLHEAGMAGFYFIRDDIDTGDSGNPLNLPSFPYETALAIQDRMFTDDGNFFYPAFAGDPYYQGFITKEKAKVKDNKPTALAEFFGDHMLVNGKIWPKAEVEPRNYRLRFLNGCDSRFLAIQFYQVPLDQIDFAGAVGPLPFTVIGSDQGLGTARVGMTTLLMETGSRYDVVFDFRDYEGWRIIMKNIGGDEPFGGDIPGRQIFGRTDRIMAFDVELSENTMIPDNFNPDAISFPFGVPATTSSRQVGLFEGTDNFGRLMPLLGTVGPSAIPWPPEYDDLAGLSGWIDGTVAWHSPTTEKPLLGTTEEWEVWNMSGDAHPIHLHLVKFQVIGRSEIDFEPDAEGGIAVLEESNNVACTGPSKTYLVAQPLVQHDGELGGGFRVCNPTEGAVVPPRDEYFEDAFKDVVTALPGQITRIRASFDKPGRYVWHCHILSHEDHEMMRVMEVVEPPPPIPAFDFGSPKSAAQDADTTHLQSPRDETPTSR